MKTSTNSTAEKTLIDNNFTGAAAAAAAEDLTNAVMSGEKTMEEVFFYLGFHCAKNENCDADGIVTSAQRLVKPLSAMDSVDAAEIVINAYVK